MFLFALHSVFNANVALQFNTTTAAVSGYRIVANFNGTNTFTDNIGGGIVLSESRLNVQGTLILSGNVAVNGGGLAMFGRCLVRHTHTYSNFIIPMEL